MSEILPLGHRFPYGCDRDGTPIIEDNRIKNDYERWLVGTYAIWSYCFSRSLRYAGGFPRTEANRYGFKQALKIQWQITERDHLLDNIFHQTFVGSKNDPSFSAWNLTRANSLCAMGYLTNLISRDEMLQISSLPSQFIQENFSSWEELGTSYLAGYENWRRGEGDRAISKDIRQRRKAFLELKQLKKSPWRLSFHMELPKCDPEMQLLIKRARFVKGAFI